MRFGTFLPLICMMAAGDQPGGGGAPAPGGDGDDDKPMTRAEMQTFINTTVTGAVQGHLKRLDFKGMIAGALKEAMPAKEPANEEPTGDPGKGGKTDPKLAMLERQLAEMKAEQARKDAEADKRVKDAAMRDAVSQLRAQLTGKVRPEAVDLAINDLRARGAIVLGDDNVATLRLTPHKGTDPVDFGFDDGVAEYLRTPQAAVLLPAPSAGGTGTPRQQPGGGRGAPFNTSKPLSQWTEGERQAFHQSRLAEVAEAHSKNPLG